MKEWVSASLVFIAALMIMFLSVAILMRETHLMQIGIERYVLNK